jgi:hypothetical protein
VRSSGWANLSSPCSTRRAVPSRSARSARPELDGFVVVAPVGGAVSDGPCALNFHTHGEVFDGQENVGLLGACAVIDADADGACVVRMRVERALADWGVPRNPVRSAITMVRASRRLRPRLVAESAQRDTALPTFDQVRT